MNARCSVSREEAAAALPGAHRSPRLHRSDSLSDGDSLSFPSAFTAEAGQGRGSPRGCSLCSDAFGWEKRERIFSADFKLHQQRNARLCQSRASESALWASRDRPPSPRASPILGTVRHEGLVRPPAPGRSRPESALSYHECLLQNSSAASEWTNKQGNLALLFLRRAMIIPRPFRLGLWISMMTKTSHYRVNKQALANKEPQLRTELLTPKKCIFQIEIYLQMIGDLFSLYCQF